MTPFDALQVQRFDDLYDSTPSARLTLAEVLDAITDGAYAAAIRHLRAVFAQQGEDAYRVAKQRLPQMTFAGTFAPTRAKDHLVQHSEICHADIDHLHNLLATKQQLQGDPCVVYCFTSPRGDGLKYGVRVPRVDTDDGYKHTWATLAAAHLDAYGVTWDPTGKDICRLCFVSWDAACYVNPDATAYPVPPPMVIPPAPRPPQSMPTRPLSPDALQRQVERVVQIAAQMIAASVPGQQHFARCRAAYLLGGLVGGRLLSSSEAATALEIPVQSTATNVQRAMKDISDCLKAGETKPITQADLDVAWMQWQANHPLPTFTTRPLGALATRLASGVSTPLRRAL